MLTDKEIIKEIETGNIVINPFVREQLNTNSYDFTLSDEVTIFSQDALMGWDIGCIPSDKLKEFYKIPNHKSKVFFDFVNRSKTPTFTFKFDGFLQLKPDHLYLMSSAEKMGTKDKFFPLIGNRSSNMRVGLKICSDAGYGDTGFNNYWTLEVEPKYNTIVQVGQKIGQIYFTRNSDEVLELYNKKSKSHYNHGDNKAQTIKF